MAAAATKVAPKVKVGLLKRLGNYVGFVLNDYKVVAQETISDITGGSVKAAVYLSSLVLAGVLYKSNPSRRDFETLLMEEAHKLSLVGAPIRSKKADEFVDKLCSAHRDGRLHHTSLGLFSLVWLNDQRDELDLYGANCKHTNLPWYQWHKKVVDVGVLGKFQTLHSSMKDYDINSDEWGESESL